MQGTDPRFHPSQPCSLCDANTKHISVNTGSRITNAVETSLSFPVDDKDEIKYKWFNKLYS